MTIAPGFISSAVSGLPDATGPEGWVWVLLLVAGSIATVTDLRSMRIPNWLTLPLLGAGIAHGGWLHGFGGIGDSLAGAAIAGGIFLAAYALAGGGAGDAKLMMAIGSWIGLDASVPLVLGVTASGFVYAMIVTVARGSIRDVPIVIFHGLMMVRFGVARLLGGRLQTQPAAEASAAPGPRHRHWFPYAPAILVGTAVTWWYLAFKAAA
ncbi:MAG: prepilin peptidase [Phycisphaerales bacterium]|jgi:prepilin peptidase CpaA